MGGKTEERITPDTPFAIASILVGRDAFVDKVRWSCVTEQEDDTLAKLRISEIEKGLTFQQATTAEVCETAVAEAARRGTFDGLYWWFNPQNPRGAYEQILRQALQNSTDTGIPIHESFKNEGNGKTHGLSCALAFEAGYRFGTENPDKDPAPNMPDEQVQALVQQCLVSGSTLPRTAGVVAGAKRAQARGEDITALVPDARSAEARQR
ncbi:hypothetical protein DLJ53_33480 [Acuticoccus sediminis]|uniref:Uncharacterized protein n=1 Tax=Acuticoccus sediminis TaxID=2184697 RepID=A0A8B2NCM8_9HYPH|nr:hypothetical protein [Acuticoccus sediminis]RAH96062.1 hypothetical protein DLJ53_33480 [Acuticoccus sediminis]